MEIYDKEFKMPKGAMPKTMEGIEKRIHLVYEMNKDKIDSVVAARQAEDIEYARRAHKRPKRFPASEKLFRASVLQEIEGGLDVNEATRNVFNQDFFTSSEVRGRHNIAVAIKKDADFFHDFRVAAGWKNKFDIGLLVFHPEYGSRGLWVYNNLFAIDTDDSPKDGSGGGLKITPLKELQARLF